MHAARDTATAHDLPVIMIDSYGGGKPAREYFGGHADHPVLGMPADSDWVLRGPFTDKSLIREALVYDLGRVRWFPG